MIKLYYWTFGILFAGAVVVGVVVAVLIVMTLVEGFMP